MHLDADHFIDALHDASQHRRDVSDGHRLQQAQQQLQHSGRGVPTGRLQVMDSGVQRLQGTYDL